MIMKGPSFLFVVVVLATSVAVVRSDVSFIEKICKETPNYNLCVSILESDPRGASADTSGLALILVDNIKDTAMKTLQEINRLYKKRQGLRKPLKVCLENYKTILEADVTVAIEAITKGNPKFAEGGIADAAVEASDCEGGFKGKSPLTRLTKSMQDITAVTRTIVRMLL